MIDVRQIVKSNYYGICEDQNIYRGKNIINEECFEYFETLSDFCASNSYLDINYYQDQQFYINGSEKVFSSTIENIYLFEEDKSSYSVIDSDLGSKYAISILKCSCLNVVKKVVYRFYENKNQVFLDIYIDSVINFPCKNKIKYSHYYAVGLYFLGQKNSTYIRSGNPGYQMGLPILFRNVSTNSVGNVSVKVYQPYYEFSFIDESGQCIYYNETEDASSYSITNEGINFGEDLILSCYVQYDLNSFKNFCTENQYKLLWLYYEFQNSVTHIGIYGNSNPVFDLDWLILEKNTIESLTSQWDASQSIIFQVLFINNVQHKDSCTIYLPVLDIFYSKFGVESDYQIKINSAQLLYQSYTIKYTGIDPSYIQKINLFMSVAYYEIESPVYFYISPLPQAQKMSPDVLYPFYPNENIILSLVAFIIILINLISF